MLRQTERGQEGRCRDEAIRLEPSKASYYLDVGAILLERDRPQGALEAAARALQINPSSFEAWYLQGSAQKKLGDLRDAVKSYARATTLRPNSARALLALALAQMEDGQTAAQITFERGIRQFPGDALFYQEYSRMLLSLKRNPASQAKAVSLLEKAIVLDGSLAEPHYELGRLDMENGNLGEAVAQFQASARLDPGNGKTHYALAMLYRRLGRTEDATRELQIFKKLEGRDRSGAQTP
ncbi:MAG: tetratricopeptide repeat protein [Terriglobia bacterium]